MNRFQIVSRVIGLPFAGGTPRVVLKGGFPLVVGTQGAVWSANMTSAR